MTNPPKFIKSKTELPKGTDQAHVKQIIALQKKWGYVLESNGVVVRGGISYIDLVFRKEIEQ